MGKETACNAGDLTLTLVRKIPWRREWLPTSIFLPGKFHGQRSLSGCSPKGYKESDTTEQLSRHAKVRNINNWPIKIHFCLIPKPKKCPAPLSSSGAVLVYI